MKSVNEIREELYQAIQMADLTDSAAFQFINSLFKGYSDAISALEISAERSEHFEGYFQLHDLFCKKHDERLSLVYGVNAYAAATESDAIPPKNAPIARSKSHGRLRLRNLLDKKRRSVQAPINTQQILSGALSHAPCKYSTKHVCRF